LPPSPPALLRADGSTRVADVPLTPGALTEAVKQQQQVQQAAAAGGRTQQGEEPIPVRPAQTGHWE